MNFEDVFRSAFIPLQEIFGHNLSDGALSLYATVLKNQLSPQEFKDACVHAVKHFKSSAACRFPAPAHFIEYAQGTPEDKASAAVTRVVAACLKIGPNRSVNFNDKALHRTIERFGGWEEMRDFDWKFRETNFKKAYLAELAMGENFGPEYLDGCYEKQNRLTQHTWNRGTPQPLLIVHVGGEGEKLKELPPGKPLEEKEDGPKRMGFGDLKKLGLGEI